MRDLRLYVGAHNRRRGGYRYDGIEVRAVDVATHPGYRSLEGGGPASDAAILKLGGRSPTCRSSAWPRPRDTRGRRRVRRDRHRLGRHPDRPAARAARHRPAQGRAAPPQRLELRPRLRPGRLVPAQRHALRPQPQRRPPAEHLAVRRRQRRAARRRRPAGRHRELRHLVRRAARAHRLLPRHRAAPVHRRPGPGVGAAAARPRVGHRHDPRRAHRDLPRPARSAAAVDRIRYRWGLDGLLVATGRRVRVTRGARGRVLQCRAVAENPGGNDPERRVRGAPRPARASYCSEADWRSSAPVVCSRILRHARVFSRSTAKCLTTLRTRVAEIWMPWRSQTSWKLS